MTFSGHSCSQQSAFKQICFTSHIKKNQKNLPLPQRRLHQSVQTSSSWPRHLEAPGTCRQPSTFSCWYFHCITLLSDVGVLVCLVHSSVFRIEMPDGLVDGLVRRLHLVFQLVLPVLIRAVSPLSVEVNPLLLC